MIEFAYPLVFIALILPVLVYFAMPKFKVRRGSIQVPYFQLMVALSGKKPSSSSFVRQKRRIQWVLLIFGWLCLVCALAKPQWVGEPVEKVMSARDILIAVDLSGSMSEQDFISKTGEKIDRLSAVKEVLREFAMSRTEDRLGLIVFADAAYLQAPFTNNIASWLALLDGIRLKMAGWLTSMGDAIGLSINVFNGAQTDNRVLILLTDGTDTGSSMPPLKAAEIAAKHQIKIYTIAMGSPQTKGRVKLDINTLQRIANTTGGKHYLAMNREELAAIYQEISALETQEYKTLSYRPKTSLHHWPVMVFLVVFIMAKLLSQILSFIIKGNTQRREPL